MLMTSRIYERFKHTTMTINELIGLHGQSSIACVQSQRIMGCLARSDHKGHSCELRRAGKAQPVVVLIK